MPGLDVPGWFVLFAPKGVPPEIVAKLNAALKKGREDPDSRKQLLAVGLTSAPVGEPAQLTEFVRSEREKWGRFVKSANIKAD